MPSDGLSSEGRSVGEERVQENWIENEECEHCSPGTSYV